MCIPFSSEMKGAWPLPLVYVTKMVSLGFEHFFQTREPRGGGEDGRGGEFSIVLQFSNVLTLDL